MYCNVKTNIVQYHRMGLGKLTFLSPRLVDCAASSIAKARFAFEVRVLVVLQEYCTPECLPWNN